MPIRDPDRALFTVAEVTGIVRDILRNSRSIGVANIERAEQYGVTLLIGAIERQQRAQLAEIKRLGEALREIAEPVAFMRKRAESDGHKLNGRMAVSLSDDANFLKSIAREALKEAGELSEKGKP